MTCSLQVTKTSVLVVVCISFGLGDTELAKRRAINLYTSSLSKGAQSLYAWVVGGVDNILFDVLWTDL